MSAVVKETYKGRQRNGASGTRTYYITGVTTETDAIAALLTDTECPTELDALLPRIDAECSAEELETGRYLGTAQYRSRDTVVFQPPDSFSISFDISGQSLRVTQSKKTMGKYGRALAGGGTSTPKDFQGAINVQQDGTVEGTELIFPFLAYTVTYTFSSDEITTDFVNTIALIVGAVNNDTFHGYAAGELLLTCCSGQKRNDSSGNWDLRFVFAVSRNKTDLIIGGIPNEDDLFGDPVAGDNSITVTSKCGWDYLWVRYEEQSRGTGADAVCHKVPVSAYVEQVYYYSDYSLLGI